MRYFEGFIMKVTFKIEMGQLVPYSAKDRATISNLKDGVYSVDIKNLDMRTLKQNRAMHKYFSLLSEAFNESGQTISKVLKVDVEWTPESVKDLLWRPIMEASLKKKSTTKLNKDEITKVYDVLNRALGERVGISIPFPNKELEG
jgi:hypothetical protein